jgi:hypothetical protein
MRLAMVPLPEAAGPSTATTKAEGRNAAGVAAREVSQQGIEVQWQRACMLLGVVHHIRRQFEGLVDCYIDSSGTWRGQILSSGLTGVMLKG